jgi:hypothetical protein
MLKSEGGYWVPETLVEQSKTRNGHGSGTQIGWDGCQDTCSHKVRMFYVKYM